MTQIGCHLFLKDQYFKLIERDGLVPLHLARALLGIVECVLGPGILNFVLDDTLVLRHSTKAPGCAIRFDHAHKKNRPTYLLSQCWVTLGVHIGQGRVLLLLSRLVPTTGNRNKISLALALLKTVAKAAKCPVRLLCDSWFMRRRLIGIGGSHHRLRPCHTTRHAGPHRAVREVEVMRVGVLQADQSTQSSAPF